MPGTFPTTSAYCSTAPRTLALGADGVSLLRDEGLKYNPGDAQLYYELGWLYQHKIGGSTDKMHQYYKEQWLLEMQNLFGGGRPDLTTNAQHHAITTYRLDPVLIRETEEAFGQLDWRLPETHALYWAKQGLPFASESQKLNLERMIFQSLATAFMTGNW